MRGDNSQLLIFCHHKPARLRYAFLVGLVVGGSPLTPVWQTLLMPCEDTGAGTVLGDEGKAVGWLVSADGFAV
jgi:hypothetical protein